MPGNSGPLNLHPLDPLTAAEVSLASKLIREKINSYHLIVNRVVFNSITLKEPEKGILLPLLEAVAAGGKESIVEQCNNVIPRRALVILVEKVTGKVTELVVNLTDESVESWTHVAEGYQPTLSPDDCFDSERIAKGDKEVQRRFKELGYDNVDLLVADPWSVGYSGDEPEFENKRLVQLFMYAREFDEDNHYAHPLDFVTIVDLNAEKVIRIDELPAHTEFLPRKNGLQIPRKPLNYDPKLLPKEFLRKDVKPLQVLQPEGPSFTVHGNQIQWQKFQFRISFNYREGLVLHDVRYRESEDKIRSLFYRMSISEMVVPYGDPRPPFHRKSAFDVGDYGLGYCANSLLLGCDCLGTIKYFNATLNDHEGNPTVIKNAVCLHEQDAGILWKHTEYRTGKVNVVRGRELVLSFIVTVVNYEYAFYWTFSQDGTISLQIKATGELSTSLLADPSQDPAGHGSIVAEGINAQYHQHIFAVRLDTMVDGPRNTVSVVDVVPLEGGPGSKGNPYGQGFTLKETVLKDSASACGSINVKTSRVWNIGNDSVINPISRKPTAWKLIPMNASAPLMAQEGSKIRDRAGFARNSLWVTKYKEDQLYAGGFYVNQSQGGDGLPSWISSADNIVDEDLVVWHTFGVTHIPRIEDFPIMPVETCGFSLKPCNFFTSNPALDVPPTDKTTRQSMLAPCH